MTREDYSKYYINGSDHYLIPKDIFNELFNEMENWKKEAQKQKEVIDKAISQLGMYADILTNNCDAYSICVSLLDTLKRGGINGRRRFQEKI